MSDNRLVAPAMSVSSSAASSATTTSAPAMWSNESSRRTSTASSVLSTPDGCPTVDGTGAEADPFLHNSNPRAAAAAALASPLGSMASPVTASTGSLALPVAARQQQQLQRQVLDPLSRKYPKPVTEVDVAEALARQPAKWTLGYWSKNAKDVQSPSASSSALAQQRFEATKRELRRAHSEMATRPTR